MNRENAINLIAELEDECKEISGRSFMLIRPDSKNNRVSGYQIRIKAKLTETKLRCIETLAAQYGYFLLNQPEKETLVIYEPIDKKGFRNTQTSNGSGIM